MKIRIVAALFFLSISSNIYSQPFQPVLKSNSGSVDVTIDNNKGSWNVEPDTKPNTKTDFLILEYSTDPQKVTYKSDIDSITYFVKPGDRYEFKIRMSDQREFLVGITTMNAPAFLNRWVLFSILMVFIVLGWLLYRNWERLNRIALLYMGVIAPLSFWLLTAIGGLIHGGYNHLTMVVSELGAIGTKSEVFMSAAEMLICLLTILSIVGFFKACKETHKNVWPPLSILSLAFSMVWAAIFPMHHVLHGSLGPIPLLMPLGALVAVFIWRGRSSWPLRISSLIGFLLMMLLLTRTIPSIQNQYPGMVQRFFYFGWTFWSIALSIQFLKLTRK